MNKQIEKLQQILNNHCNKLQLMIDTKKGKKLINKQKKIIETYEDKLKTCEVLSTIIYNHQS